MEILQLRVISFWQHKTKILRFSRARVKIAAFMRTVNYAG